MHIMHIYTDFQKEVKDKDPKFKIGYHLRKSKYKNILKYFKMYF